MFYTLIVIVIVLLLALSPTVRNWVLKKLGISQSSIDKIVANFHKAIDELDDHIDAKKSEVADLNSKAVAAQNEVAHAENIKANFASIIAPPSATKAS